MNSFMCLISSRAFHTDMACILHVKTEDSKDSVVEDAPIANSEDAEKESQSDDHDASAEPADTDVQSEDKVGSKDGPVENNMAEATDTQESMMHTE